MSIRRGWPRSLWSPVKRAWEVSRCAVGFQAEIDAGAREGLTGDEAAEIKALEAGLRRLPGTGG